MNIGDLAKKSGLTTKTIRYYESIGVLPQARRADNGYRIYEQGTVDRLAFVKDAQAAGLSLTEITSILELRGQGASTCEHVSHLLDHHLAELDERIKVLKKTRKRMAELAARAGAVNPTDCVDPNRCQTIAPGIESLPGVEDLHPRQRRKSPATRR